MSGNEKSGIGCRRLLAAVMVGCLAGLATGTTTGTTAAGATQPTYPDQNGIMITFAGRTTTGEHGVRFINTYYDQLCCDRPNHTGGVYDNTGMRSAMYDATTNRITVEGVEGGTPYKHVITPENPGFTAAKDFRWSPDMRRLAFLASVDGTNYDVFTIAAGTTPSQPVRLTTGGAPTPPTWSPDSVSVAYAARVGGGDHELVTQRASGTRRLQVTNDSFDQTEPTWSPTGTFLAYATNEAGGWAIKQVRIRRDLFGFWRIGAGGFVAPPSSRTISSTPVYSPDSSRLLVAYSTVGIVVYAPQPGQPTTYPWGETAAGQRPQGPVIWSADGTQAAYVSGGEVYTIDLATATPTQATTGGNATAVISWQSG